MVIPISGKTYRSLRDALTPTTKFKGFKGTVFGFPLLYGITGTNVPDGEMIERALKQLKGETGGYHLQVLWLAELVDSTKEDSDRFFIGDDRFRGICVGLNEGTNGWALIIGDAKNVFLRQLTRTLTEKRLRLYVAGPASEGLEATIEQFTSLGVRETSMVYFAQMLVRYALIYGMTIPGETHEVSHLIEEKAPGVVFVLDSLTELEDLLVQGMLALGVPVITMREDHGLVGHVVVAESVTDMVEAAWDLPNVRARRLEKASPEIPVPSGPRLSREKIEEDNVAVRLAGSDSSFIVTMPSNGVDEDEVRALGSPENPTGFSIIVELGNEAADPPVTLWVESILRRVVNYAKGVRVSSEGNNIVELRMTRAAVDAGFELVHLGNLIRTELRNEFYAIGPIRVTFLLDRDEEERRSREILEFIEERSKQIRETTEDDLEFFYGCTRCRSFALAHACTVTPDRPAQCSKPWYQIKANAVLAPGHVYNACQLIERGECLDPLRGEYGGVNESTHDRSEGRVDRVFLHSIFDFPHTSCSCFQNVAYYIPEVDGIGIMNRGYHGEAPNGMSWTKLANRVAGKQYREGAAAMATAYLLSKKFLQGDGGYRRVVWMAETLKRTANRAIPKDLRVAIATENEATTLEELIAFLESRGRAIAPL
jgi:acetyl-CoA decarbonylase/synthase complex subunit beta